MDIKYNKGLGQNFIYDTNLLRAIVSDSGIDKNDTVLEIGAGAGSLTKELAQKAKRVISFEIDRNLTEHLNAAIKDFDNVEIKMADFLSVKPDELNRLTGGKFKVVANLPYYITTPILFFLLENSFDVESITILVQKEVAQRLTAKAGSSDYGALTLTVGAQYDAKIKRIVTKEMFTPRPKVDSAVVNLVFREPFDARLNKTIRALFSMRRKTVVNNLMGGFSLPRAVCEKIILDSNINLLARAEELDLSKVKLINKNLIAALT